MLGFVKNRTPKASDKAGEEVKFTGANEMTDLLVGLNTSEKKHSRRNGLFNKNDSVEFQAVKDALFDVVSKTNGTFSSDAASNDAMMEDMLNSYGRLVMRCTKYLGKKGGKTTAGKARKDKVQMILDLAQKDCQQIEYYRRENQLMDGEERANLSWSEIIHTAREALIEVADMRLYSTSKGQAKTEATANRFLNNGVFSSEAIQNSKENSTYSSAAFNNYKDNPFKNADEKLNFSGRNVATSRVAKLIGLEGIVEESASVRVKDKSSGEIKRGNLMSLAKGTAAGSEVNKVRKETAGLGTGKEAFDKRESIVAAKMTGSFRKDLSSLQVLDYLCGQGDRNTGNYFIEQDDQGRYAHVHGIDNDMSFGNGVDYEKHVRDHKGIYDLKLRVVVDGKNNLRIPHMDKQLAMNILKVTPEELRFVLEDLIEPRFIDFTIERLKNLQEGIRKEEAHSTGIFVDNDSEWDNNHADFQKKGRMRRVYEEAVKQNVGYNKQAGSYSAFNLPEEYLIETALDGTSYYSDLVEAMMGGNGVYQSLKWM